MTIKWQWSVSKRRMALDCPLFEDGNAVCYAPSKQVPEAEEYSDNQDTDSNSLCLEDQQKYTCDIAGCGKSFTSLNGYEIHYNSLHRCVCHQCKRCFPNHHLLDIHLLEWHDSMFDLLAQKQPMYQCLVESCQVKMKSKAERKNHMIKVHKYPGNYRFDREPNKSKSRPQVKDEDSMQVDSTPSNDTQHSPKESPQNGSPRLRQFSYSVPKNICFGQGSSKCFARGRGRGQTRGKGKKKHWHNAKPTDIDTSVDIESVNMKDLEDALQS